MKTATVRVLCNEFARVSRWIEEGESVEITKDGEPFARLTPTRSEQPEKVMPDFLARMRGYMDKPLPPGAGQSVVDYDRGDR